MALAVSRALVEAKGGDRQVAAVPALILVARASRGLRLDIEDLAEALGRHVAPRELRVPLGPPAGRHVRPQPPQLPLAQFGLKLGRRAVGPRPDLPRPKDAKVCPAWRAPLEHRADAHPLALEERPVGVSRAGAARAPVGREVARAGAARDEPRPLMAL
eukprot:1075287-Prymnesium_polylepis.1